MLNKSELKCYDKLFRAWSPNSSNKDGKIDALITAKSEILFNPKNFTQLFRTILFRFFKLVVANAYFFVTVNKNERTTPRYDTLC